MRILVILGILIGMFGAVAVASATDSGPGRPLQLASSDDQKAEEKKAGEQSKKDEKPKDSEEKEKKERQEKKKEKDKHETSTSSSTSDGFSACVFDILSGICCSMFDGSDGETPTSDGETPTYARIHEYDVTHEYEEPLTGLIELRHGSAEEVMVWDMPGGEIAGSWIAFHVPVGVEVLIWKRAVAREDTAWLEISRLYMESTRGWVRAQDVIIQDMHEPDMLMAGASPDSMEVSEEQESGITIQPFGWLRGDFSWYTFLGEPLWGEYDGRGYQGRAMYHLLTGSSLQLGAGVSFARGHGRPTVVYDTPSLFDEPLDSRLDIFSIDFQIGQYLMWDGGSKSFAWGIGPTVFRVKESATIKYTEFEDGRPGRSGLRTDTMTKWKLGFDARISLQQAAKGKYPIGVVTGFSFIPWDSKEEESLTLDWLNKEYFVTYQLGLTFGGLFF